MRVIKTYNKQIELAELGLLFCIVNCAYLRVSAEHRNNGALWKDSL